MQRAPFNPRNRVNRSHSRNNCGFATSGGVGRGHNGHQSSRGAFMNSQSSQSPVRSTHFQNHSVRPSRKNLAECNSLLQSILSNNDNINTLLINGDLLNLLNSATQLNHNQTYSFLSSLNQFKVNENSPKSIKDTFIMVLNSNFFSESLERIIKQYFVKIPDISDLIIIIYFFINCLELLPNQFLEKMGILYPSIIFIVPQFNNSELNSLLQRLTNRFEAAKKKVEDEKSLSLTFSKVVNIDHKFRDYSVVPQSSDIFCLNSEVPLRPNKFSGNNNEEDSTYASVDDYLDTQFCLLKEDFVRPLREGIATVRTDMLTKPKIETKKLQIRLYERVIVEDMYTSRNGLVHKVVFDVTKFGRIDWKKARRFIYGSLLCFTNNFFDTVYFATVIESDPKNLEKGFLIVQFNDDPISEVLENNIFMMIETKNLFEAYRHVLVKLQTFCENTLPFKDYFVFRNNVTRFPAFMNRSDLRMIELEGAKDKEFDNSQSTAFVNALQSSLSLIQGPPGTGKTYVGLKMIKYLSNYFQTNVRNIGPILVVCYTNHALDQFLCDIIEAIGIDSVIRVGGRSKMEVMKECNISSIKWKWIRKKSFEHNLYKSGIQNRRNIEIAEENLVRKYVKVKNYDKRLLSFKDLHGCLSQSQVRYFQKINFDSWIKGGDSILEINLESCSNLKQSIIMDQCMRCIDDIVHEGMIDVVRGLFAEFNVPLEDDFDLLVEDPDDVLFNQRFLDDDVNILKNGNRFQRLYTELENGVGNGGEDEEEFKYVANAKLIKNKLKKIKPLSEEEYITITSLDVDFDVRLKLYKYWLEKYRIILMEEYKMEKSKFDIVNKERDDIHNKEYIAIMKSMKVIGMTTTGAARYGSVLDRVGCQVVVIEEAAEVMEAHVVCSLSKHCEQLIMIGDHKQLRPKVDVYDLEINYNLGISLFERLIGNDYPHFTLEYQHRMRPEIATCVKPIYPNLKNSEVVFNYPSISGMKKNIYFFNHNSPENSSIDTSYKNDFEADFVANLCEYLIKSGNLANSITVLTLYSGQLYNISNRMRQQMFKGIRICVIDNFQGEENDIIILSFVRSNINNIVGFVSSENRLCVTLSRAKRGFYAIGNFNMICHKSTLLREVIDNHLDKQCFGSKLPLTCLMHPNENKYFITKLEDFQKKGCPSKCGLELTCGHLCTLTCHREAPSHKGYRCAMPCTKLCARDCHQCKLLCHQRCCCDEPVTVTLTCGHDREIICQQTEIKCIEICQKDLNCGHRCMRMCHEKCMCEIKIKHFFECGHPVDVDCGVDVSKLKCLQLCGKCLDCGHPCGKKCSDKCACKQIVEYTLPCSHKKKLQCGTDISQALCNIVVDKLFNCGHLVKYECFKNVSKCSVKVNKALDCGHRADIQCGDASADVICQTVCTIQLDCRHKCQGICSECYQGRLHVACKGKCRKFLRCSHYCDGVCHPGFCPPCRKRCIKYCTHSQCTSVCGQPCECKVCEAECPKRFNCVKCKESHKCSQRCGESCSKLCHLCLTTLYKDNANYYIMEPCNCYILKADFKPKIKIEGKEISLICQDCDRYLRSPYSGVVLMYFKLEYSALFQLMPKTEVLKWETLLHEFKTVNCLPENFQKMIETVCKTLICKEDMLVFEISYKYYLKLLHICKILATIDGENRIHKYYNDIRKALLFLIKWLDPFKRNYLPTEIDLLKLAKSKLNLSSDVLSFLNSVTVADYALVHKKLFDILDEIEYSIEREDIDTLSLKVDEIKRNINNTKESSKEEEEFVNRIITAKDIYKEFGLDRLSVEDKLKEIKNLIRRCHPDKNRSPRANEAVRILLVKKKLLE